MTDYNANYNVNDDPYAVDTERVKEEVESKGTGSGPKVKWHNLPEGDSLSTWRILPFVKRRSFFFKVTKHWNVPGFKGSVTCPRSFDDPANPGKKFRCAICEKFFEMYKSSDPAEVAIAKSVLKSSQSYYVNAVNMDKPEEGVGVLNLPYGAWKTLYDWLSNPRLQMFSHPFRGRNVIIKSSTVAGSQIPGQPGKQKREYTVMPDDMTEITNKEWLDQLYDLESVVGIPTYDMTDVCLKRLLAGDESVAKLPEGTPAYRGQLTAGTPPAETPQNKEDEDFYKPVQPTQVANIPPTTVTNPTPAFVTGTSVVGTTPITSEAPKFAQAPVVSTLNTTAAPAATNPQEDEIARLKAQLAKLQGGTTAPVTQTAPVTSTPVQGIASEDEIRKQMEAALGGKF